MIRILYLQCPLVLWRKTLSPIFYAWPWSHIVVWIKFWNIFLKPYFLTSDFVKLFKSNKISNSYLLTKQTKARYRLTLDDWSFFCKVDLNLLVLKVKIIIFYKNNIWSYKTNLFNELWKTPFTIYIRLEFYQV